MNKKITTAIATIAITCTAFVAVALTPEAKKEMKASQKAYTQCKRLMQDIAEQDRNGDKKAAERQTEKALDKVEGYCGSPIVKGCKVKTGSKSCTFYKVDGDREVTDRRGLSFPKDF